MHSVICRRNRILGEVIWELYQLLNFAVNLGEKTYQLRKTSEF